jgi:hypothetical protein
MKKAQASMEYLMTHGWAVLAILAAIAALAYFGVLNPQNFLPDYCQFSQGIACTDTGFSGNSLTLILKNSLGNDLTNVHLALTSMDGCVINATGSQNLLNSGQASYTFDVSGCNFQSRERLKATLALSYVSAQSSLQHTRNGELVIKVP